MTITATIPATAAAILSINAPWHPVRPASVTVSGGVATLTADGLAALYWYPMALALGGTVGEQSGPVAGALLIDGAPLLIDGYPIVF